MGREEVGVNATGITEDEFESWFVVLEPREGVGEDVEEFEEGVED